MSSERPNLFDYATSELSQDAFICWLLAWANPACKTIDAALHQCAKQFIKALIGKIRPFEDAIWSVEIKRQWEKLDILCVINESIAILIEDKTYTQEGNDQLDRYLKSAETALHQRKSFSEIIPIYLKTWDQSDLTGVEQAGWKTFMRKDFLEVLGAGKKAGVENAIFMDFHKHLERLQKAIDSWKKKPVEQWCDSAWTGFFEYLQREKGMDQGEWGYVNSPKGAFLGFWWSFKKLQSGITLYLQIEAFPVETLPDQKPSLSRHSICFKIAVPENGKDQKEERYSARQHWHQVLGKEVNKILPSGTVAEKPGRFGYGETMTVLKIDNPIGKSNLLPENAHELLLKLESILKKQNS